MRYASIRSMDVSNGTGIGVALFVQGCHFHCKDCFNEETWDFDGGKEFDDDTRQYFIQLVGKKHINRVSILGGCPLCDENVKEVYELLRDIKHAYPSITVWVYTGYTWEQLIQDEESYRFKILNYIDVLVDGKYENDKRDLSLAHKGSRNQRVIDVQTSLALEANTVFLYE